MPKLTWEQARELIEQKVDELKMLPENQPNNREMRFKPSKTLARLLREERGGSYEVSNRD